MDIEGYAAAKVLESLASTDCLVAHISLRDKEPIWDGSVYVYTDSEKHKNENLKGRVPVQIKGEIITNKKKFKGSIKYQIKIVDLKHYLLDGGAIFFVVQINQEKNDSQIYALRLLPYTIKKALSDTGPRQYKTMELEKFPSTDSKKLNWFFNMINDMTKQKTVIQSDHLQTLEEIQKHLPVERIEFSFTDVAVDKLNPYKYLMENTTFKYVKISGGITIPIGEIQPADKITLKSDAEVSCGGQVFFDSYTNEFTKKQRTMLLGKCVSITFPATGQTSATFNFSVSGTLQEVITGASFFCTFYKEEKLYIGKDPLIFSAKTDSEKKKLGNGIRDLEKYINDLKNLEKALQIVGFHKDLILSDLSKQDEHLLNLLVSSIVFYRTVKLDDAPDRSHCFVMKFSKYSIMLLAMRVSENRFQLVNFFSQGVSVKAEDDGQEKALRQAPGVILLSVDNFLSLDNIDYNIIYNEITRFQQINKTYYFMVNQLLLRMLLAFDQKNDSELLTCATRIAEWLCSLTEYSDKAIDTLNYLQIVRRQRDLTDAEKAKLVDIITQNPQNSNLIAGAYIVLQDYGEAQKAFSQLSESEQKDFRQWPIMNLWKDFEQQTENKA